MTCVPCLALPQHANRDERGRRGRLGGRPFGKMLGCEILVDSVIAANPGLKVNNVYPKLAVDRQQRRDGGDQPAHRGRVPRQVRALLLLRRRNAEESLRKGRQQEGQGRLRRGWDVGRQGNVVASNGFSSRELFPYYCYIPGKHAT